MSQTQIDNFLDEPHVGIIVTTNRDGTPNPQPVWYLRRGDALLIRTGARSVKARNIARDARISMCVQQETLPYKSVTLWGTAAVSDADDAALGRAIAVRYLGETGADRYLAMSTDAEPGGEITITLRPDKIFSQDYSAESGA